MSLSSPPERVLDLSILWAPEKNEVVSAASRDVKAKLISDEALMEALKGRDPDALTKLFLRHSRLAFSIGFRILQDAGEAEEIVQDVFLYLYQRASQFDQAKGSAKAWIVQIAHSRSIDRKKFLQRRRFYVGTDVAGFADTLMGVHDVQREVMSKWNLAQLQIALRDLTEKQRQTLEMFFFEGLELKEIAAQLDESLENVRHYYYRGLQKLRKNGTVQKLKGEERE